jgi:hypothetical protein
VQLKLDKGLKATSPAIQQAQQFDVGVDIDNTGTLGVARPGDPTFPVVSGIGHA